jgi:hypothetical protein
MRQISELFIVLVLIFAGVELNAKETIPLKSINQNDEMSFLISDENRISVFNSGNGFGMKIMNDGAKVIGNFFEGQINGYGLYYYPTGEKYVGHFKNGYKDGEGILVDNTEVTNGIWLEDDYVRENPNEFQGCKTGDCVDGKGVYVYSDYTLYDGGFENAKASGYGICYYSDDDIYIGNWKAHDFDGQGVLYSRNGTKQDGEWSNGQFIDAYAYDVVRFEDAPIEEIAIEKGKIWAIIVGVAKYSKMPRLNFPDDDAYQFHSFLKSPKGGAIKDEQIRLFIDESATKDNIIKALRDFAEKASAEDVFIFYFSGHGVPGAFIPIDSDGFEQQIKYREFLEILETNQAKSKIIIADACYSGGLVAFKGENYRASIDNYYNEIHKSKGGLVLFMSSKAKEISIENNGLRQGIFSHYLIKGLKGEANINNDEFVRIGELFDYVQANVSIHTNEYQTPVIYGDAAINHPIGLIRD